MWKKKERTKKEKKQRKPVRTKAKDVQSPLAQNFVSLDSEMSLS